MSPYFVQSPYSTWDGPPVPNLYVNIKDINLEIQVFSELVILQWACISHKYHPHLQTCINGWALCPDCRPCRRGANLMTADE